MKQLNAVKKKLKIKGLKKSDAVFVIAGKDRGKSGKILKILTKKRAAIIEGVNLVKKHRRPRRAGEKGEIILIPMSMSVSKLMLKCPYCAKAVKISYKFSANKEKTRVCKKCGQEF